MRLFRKESEVSDQQTELEPTPLEPNRSDFETPTERPNEPSTVEFGVSDENHDYARGVYMRNARELQAIFVELYKKDPSARFRLTLEQL